MPDSHQAVNEIQRNRIAHLRNVRQEERLALIDRAKVDSGAFDELAVHLDLEAAWVEKAKRRIESLERSNEQLEQRLAVFLRKLFGRSSEKIDPAQLRLFADPVEQPSNAPADEPTTTEQIPYTRKKPAKGHGRDSFPQHLPRTAIPIEPEPKELNCSACTKPLQRVREEATERGAFIPGYWQINRYIRGVWTCRCGFGSVTMAPLPKTLVPKSRFEPSVAVASAIAKFADHQPLHRQSAAHARLGVQIAPNSLGDNVDRLAELHAKTVLQMETEVVSEKHLHCDDTPVGALVETDKFAMRRPKLLQGFKDGRRSG